MTHGSSQQYFEFIPKAHILSTNDISKCVLAPDFDNNVVHRHSFDTIWKYICFSYHPDNHPEHISSEAFQWKLVNDFVKTNKNYREAIFTPSDTIYVDEYIYSWYVISLEWTNAGL